MTIRALILLIVGLSWLTHPNTAGAQDVVDLDLGQTIRQKMGSKSELFRFVGGVGTKVTADLAAPGEVALVFYTPDGEEMISTRANGSARLDLFLPFSDVYFLAVLRVDSAKPFTLKLSSIAPDEHFAYFAQGIGWGMWQLGKQYPRCWLEPGEKYRIKGAQGLMDVIIGRGDRIAVVSQSKDGGTRITEARLSFKGDMAEMSWDGAAPFANRRFEVPKEKRGPFQGYLCTDWVQ